MKPTFNIREIGAVGILFLLSIATGMLLLQPNWVYGQCPFSSGSTGADGAFTPTNSMPNTGWSFSNNIVTVTNKTDGIFNFTSVYIETNWVVRFTRNTLNTPVWLLATTNVTIKGKIDVTGSPSSMTSADGGAGGPGGYDGGKSVMTFASSGFGPGGEWFAHAGHAFPGGQYYGGPGPAYGVIDARPLVGGSGGGGDNSGTVGNYEGGGGGGGALLIASSLTLSCEGTIDASGGDGFSGHGSGGSLRLMASTITGEGIIKAQGSNGGSSAGFIRLEACVNSRVSLTDPPATFGPPGLVFLATNPTIRVTSIAGTNTPAIPAGSLTVPDVYLPTNFVNPASISVLASNINVGTTFKIIVIPAYGTNMIASSTLSGTYAASTGTVSINVYTDRVWRVNAIIDYIPRP